MAEGHEQWPRHVFACASIGCFGSQELLSESELYWGRCTQLMTQTCDGRPHRVHVGHKETKAGFGSTNTETDRGAALSTMFRAKATSHASARVLNDALLDLLLGLLLDVVPLHGNVIVVIVRDADLARALGAAESGGRLSSQDSGALSQIK